MYMRYNRAQVHKVHTVRVDFPNKNDRNVESFLQTSWMRILLYAHLKHDVLPSTLSLSLSLTVAFFLCRTRALALSLLLSCFVAFSLIPWWSTCLRLSMLTIMITHIARTCLSHKSKHENNVNLLVSHSITWAYTAGFLYNRHKRALHNRHKRALYFIKSEQS